MGFEPFCQPVAQAAFAPRAVADRRILPKGADFINDGDTELLADAQRGKTVEHGGMGVEHIGLPLFRQHLDPFRQRTDFAPFADRRACRRDRRGAIESQPIDRLAVGPRLGMAHAGDARDFPSLGELRLHQRAGAKGVAAVRGQAMVEDVQYACHRPAH